MTHNGCWVLDRPAVFSLIKHRRYKVTNRIFKLDGQETVSKTMTKKYYWTKRSLGSRKLGVVIAYNSKSKAAVSESYSYAIMCNTKGEFQSASILLGVDGKHDTPRNNLAPDNELDCTEAVGVLKLRTSCEIRSLRHGWIANEMLQFKASPKRYSSCLKTQRCRYCDMKTSEASGEQGKRDLKELQMDKYISLRFQRRDYE